jgi:hypothetical protein
VLHGVDDDLFWYGLYDKPEVALGWRQLYMTAETQPMLSRVRTEDISDRFLPQSVTVEAIRNGKAALYDVSGEKLRNITVLYERLRGQSKKAAVLPSFIDAANPLFAACLKDGWYEEAEGIRWTGKRATVEMAGPQSPGERLRLRGRVSELHTATQPLYVNVSIDDASTGTRMIFRGAQEFELTFPLPANVLGKDAMVVAIETDRTISTPADNRPFGLAMGTVTLIR